MFQIFDFLLGGPDILPRGACMGWRPGLIALHTVSDAISGVAYLVVPAAVWVVLRQRRDLDPEVRQIGYLLMAFVLTGASIHLAAVFVVWSPAYGAQGLLKAATAVISLATAMAVWPQLPKVLRLPSPRDLRRANVALTETNASLETTIAWRTHELEQSKKRFEMALSRSNITVFTKDRDLRYTWIHNPRLGLPPGEILGRRDEDILPGWAADKTRAMALTALNDGLTVSETVTVPTGQEGEIYVDMTVSPTTDPSGAIDGVLCTAVDVTEKRLFEVRLAAMAGQLANAYRRFALAIENSPITVFEQAPDLRYTVMHNPPPGTVAEDYLGRTDLEIFSETDQARIVPAKRRVFAEGAGERLEVEVSIGGRARFYDLTLEPKRDADGTIEGVVGTAVDLTERRQTEKQMRLVMRELTHRSKNLLAVVQAMARQTASVSENVDDFILTFSARLRAVAAAHDLLVSQSWTGADLGELLRASLAQTVDPSGGHIRLEGPALLLTPDTTQNLALAFHELTTNAAKYGALSVDAGHLTVEWRREAGDVHILWRESGGPEVHAPARRGFGRVLLERLVGTTLGGSVRLSFQPEGLVCEIVFPGDRLIDD